jgi:hypothetical protein
MYEIPQDQIEEITAALKSRAFSEDGARDDFAMSLLFQLTTADTGSENATKRLKSKAEIVRDDLTRMLNDMEDGQSYYVPGGADSLKELGETERAAQKQRYEMYQLAAQYVDKARPLEMKEAAEEVQEKAVAVWAS